MSEYYDLDALLDKADQYGRKDYITAQVLGDKVAFILCYELFFGALYSVGIIFNFYKSTLKDLIHIK